MIVATANTHDLQFLTELIDDGRVVPVVDRTYSLSDVPGAIRYLREGHALGKIAITVAGAATPRHRSALPVAATA